VIDQEVDREDVGLIRERYREPADLRGPQQQPTRARIEDGDAGPGICGHGLSFLPSIAAR